MIRQHANILRREQCIPASLPTVFSFFSDARNLDRITPRWLHFKIMGQSSPELGTGTLIHYKLAWHGIPMGWTSRIEEWCPPTLFVDLQVHGPYRLWHHTHRFQSYRGGTLISDTVQYEVPLGALGRFFAGGLVRRDVERIFDFRAKQISEAFNKPSVVPIRSGYGYR
jgi:ligand-binding SRPBCC domain-containing protein